MSGPGWTWVDDILAGLVSVQIGLAAWSWRKALRFTRALYQAGRGPDPATQIAWILAQHERALVWTKWAMLCTAVPTIGVAVWGLLDVSLH